MKNLVLRIVKALSFAAIVFGVASTALATQHDAFTASQEEAIDERIRSFILENPDLVLKVLRTMEQRQKLAEVERSREQLVVRQEQILNDPGSPVGWNLEGDATIVEFFDYRCGFCRAVAPRLQELKAEDDKIRYIYKEWPILGQISEFAARAALASQEQGRYEEFHKALMTFPGRITEPDIFSVAERVGLDVTQLKQDMQAPNIEASIQQTRQLAAALGITGTPAFVIGDQLVPGALGLEQLRSFVRRAREKS